MRDPRLSGWLKRRGQSTTPLPASSPGLPSSRPTPQRFNYRPITALLQRMQLDNAALGWVVGYALGWIRIGSVRHGSHHRRAYDPAVPVHPAADYGALSTDLLAHHSSCTLGLAALAPPLLASESIVPEPVNQVVRFFGLVLFRIRGRIW
jgi:hypothetical protein